ncbi:MAG: hypothetical protein KFB97_01445 [Cyanobium sp. M30B3]|jgi:hypothetical protein|nr:MAG: hypothetical protein KFB97_01445 [Cyanobium sp. M30B3]
MTTLSRRRPLLLAAALLLLASPLQGGPALAEGREAMQRQQAEAMAKLSTQQRQQYFAARRELDQRQSAQRQEALKESEGCVLKARDGAAVERCLKQYTRKAKQARRSQMNQLAELQRRYNLPGWGGERAGKTKGGPKPGKEQPASKKGA